MGDPAEPLGSRLWRDLVTAERQFFRSRMALYSARTALLNSGVDLAELLQRELSQSGRGTALRLLPHADESVRRQLFPEVVRAASAAHSDLQLARTVLLSLDSRWLERNLPMEIERILEQGADFDEYRRLAELLNILRSPYLAVLVERAAASPDPHIREVADDFRPSAEGYAQAGEGGS